MTLILATLLAMPNFAAQGVVGDQQKSGREYENLRLRFEYNLAQWAEAAVVLRAPDRGRPMRAGIAISLTHDFHRKLGLYVTGALSGRRAPIKLLKEQWGQWTPVDIRLEGQRLQVTIAGELLQDTNVQRAGPGFILFPDLGHRYQVRNIQIDDLGSPTAISRPFAGETIQRGGGTFTKERTTITGANGHGILYAKPAFENFTLSLYARSHKRVNAGVFLRGDAREGQPRGFEVQIYSPPDAVYPTGSIYNQVRSNVSVDYEERWFYLEIEVSGRLCTVKIDGDVVAQSSNLPGEGLPAGQIGLQIHSDRASVDFDDIRVVQR